MNTALKNKIEITCSGRLCCSLQRNYNNKLIIHYNIILTAFTYLKKKKNVRYKSYAVNAINRPFIARTGEKLVKKKKKKKKKIINCRKRLNTRGELIGRVLLCVVGGVVHWIYRNK